MCMPLPCDIPMLKVFGTGNFTCPDNIFCSPSLLPTYIRCDTEPSLQPVKTDHFPIIQVLDIETVVIDHVPRPLFCTTDWGEFRKALMEELSALERPERYETVEQVETAIQRVEDTIQHVISTHVKMSKPSLYWRRWYTSLLDELHKESARLNHEAYQHRCVPDHPVHGEAWTAVNVFYAAVQDAKDTHWVDWLTKLSDNSIWDVGKMVSAEPGE
ncbi:hypothetical protein B0H17DRAFT_849515, partial [Mycena rosella]